MIKDNKGIFDILFLQALTMDVFPEKMKHADIKPFYKKESRNKKENYRRVNFLRNLSKIFECCMYDQLNDYFDKMLSKYQRGFGKGFSIQQYWLAMIEKLRKSLESGKGLQLLSWVTSLIHLIVWFDCLINYKAIYLCGGSLNLLFPYLEIKNKELSEWIENLFGMPQWSIFVSLLFNIFLCDLFLFLHGISVANNVDGSFSYCTSLQISNVLTILAATLLQWFKDNQINESEAWQVSFIYK